MLQMQEEEMPGGTIKVSFLKNDAEKGTLSRSNPFNWKPLLTQYLDRAPMPVSTAYTIFAAFSAYFSIYGMSAAIFAASFEGITIAGLNFKVALSMAQLLGYAISKVVGAFIIPTIKRPQRWRTLVLLAVLAELPLFLFGLLPPAGQLAMVFLSAVPLAWMWGIMVMYLEGRRTSEFLLMGLYLSVMVASGASKSVATTVLQSGVSESWMPSLVGGGAALIFSVFITMLDTIPDPSVEDKKARNERRNITPAETRKFLMRWAPGLIPVTLVYSMLTAYRNFRDYFAPELWQDLMGPDFNPSIFTQSELPVGICTAVAYSLLYWVKDDKKAFFAILGVMFLGGGVILSATLLQTAGLTAPLPWMIMVGVGLFMAYIPPGAMLYDRFNGATGHPYTSVFMIYMSDVCGYSVTLTILFYRNFGESTLKYTEFFYSLSFVVAFAVMGGMALAALYFAFAMRNLRKPEENYAQVALEEIAHHDDVESASLTSHDSVKLVADGADFVIADGADFVIADSMDDAEPPAQ
jgi:hypothetical protein